MNAIVAFKRDLDRVLPELALPDNVTPERFKSIATIAVQENPDILKAGAANVMSVLRKCAADGLVPDKREAALVMFGNQVSYMPMVFGLVKRLRNSGNVASITARIVYQRELDEDRFEYLMGDVERLTHRPILTGDRGKVAGAYAIATMKDGTIEREWMDRAAIEKVRNVSRASGGPWKDWYEEMCKKTVIRRLSKRLPVSSDIVDMVQRSDGGIDTIDITPPKTAADLAREKRAQMEDPSISQVPEVEPEELSQDDGTIEGEVVPDPDDPVVRAGYAAAAEGCGRGECPQTEGPEYVTRWFAGYDMRKDEEQRDAA